MTVYPFQATRYNDKKINIKKTLCPPYDVINAAIEKKLTKRTPYNSIFLSYNVSHKEGQSKYHHIPKLIQTWKQKNILHKDGRPSFYYLEERFHWKGKVKTRKGVFALIPVSKNKNIIPHEKIFSSAVSDRLTLLRHVKMNMSPIFLVYEDPKKQLTRWLTQQGKLKETIKSEYIDDHIKYRLRQVDDPASIQHLQKILNNKSLLIADGHHRFETMKRYSMRLGKQQYILGLIAPSSKNLIFSYDPVLAEILRTAHVTIGKMIKACKTGKLLPQKTTYFYPKVMTGFVFSDLHP